MQARHAAKLGVFANAIVGAGGALCTLVVVYAVARRGTLLTGPGGFVMFYVFPASWALVLFGALAMRPAFRIKLALLFVATGVSIYGAEVLLDLETAIRKARTGFDRRSPAQVLGDLRDRGIDAYPAVWPSLLLRPAPDGSLRSAITIGGREALPLGGIAGKPVIYCNESGEYQIYRTDSLGFYNPPGVRRPGGVDVAALGDSFAIGYCVPPDRSFVALIRDRYPATVNLGNIGNGPLVMLAGIKEYLEPLRPRVAIWFYYEGNDLENLSVERRSALLMRYMRDGFSQGLLGEQPEVDRSLIAYLEPLIAEAMAARDPDGRWQIFGRDPDDVFKLKNLRGRLLTFVEREVPYTGSEEVVLLGDILRRGHAMVGGWGGRLYFVYLPEWRRYKTLGLPSRYRADVLRVVREIGLPLIDLHPAFAAVPDPLQLFASRQVGSHYSGDGNRLVAEVVLRAVEEGGALTSWEPVSPRGMVSPRRREAGRGR